MSKMTKEQFIEKCDSNIKLMSTVTELSFDECTDMMLAAYNGFGDISYEDVEKIVDKLNQVTMKEIEILF